MPQDDVEEVREAMLGARHANENPVFYRTCSFIQFCFCDCKLVISGLFSTLTLSLTSLYFLAQQCVIAFHVSVVICIVSVAECPNGHPYVIGNVSVQEHFLFQ